MNNISFKNSFKLTNSLSTKDEDFMQYSLAHDLKEPVRMISIYTQLLEKKLAKIDSLDADSEDFIHFIREGAKRINTMVDGMIHLNDAGKSKEHIQAVDVADALYFVRSNLHLLIKESATKIKIIGQLPEVTIRYSHIVRILQNLLENAIKFRKPNEPAQITISATETKAQAIISVEDTGIGIPSHAHDRVFQPFQRGLSGDRNIEGSGIGLAICKKLIEQYGGRIWFESKEKHGTTFHFEVPLAEKEMFL